MSPENDNMPKLSTWQEVKQGVRGARKLHQLSYVVPTLAQLKVLLALPEYHAPVGPEWTREGWIFNSHNNELIEKPIKNARAAFRIIVEENQLPIARKFKGGKGRRKE